MKLNDATVIALTLAMLFFFAFQFAATWWAESSLQARSAPTARRMTFLFAAALLVSLCVALTGCDAPINPVRYQTVPVLVTKPCFAGKTPPNEAVTLTDPVCADSDAECVRAAKADIQELQREARQYRKLFQECSK